MKSIWIIAKRELSAFFDSLTAYILLTLFLGLSGFFTWIAIGDVFLSKQASLRVFFSIAYWSLFFQRLGRSRPHSPSEAQSILGPDPRVARRLMQSLTSAELVRDTDTPSPVYELAGFDY